MGLNGDRSGFALMEPGPVAAGFDTGPAGSPSNCAHCGTPCGTGSVEVEGLRFCCAGCRTVFELLHRHGLSRFYELSRTPGLRVSGPVGAAQFAHLDDPEVLEKVLDFSDGRRHRVTLHIPAIHCVACVWLLENLFRLHPGIGRCEVNYPRRELMVEYATEQLRLSELVALLASLGYEPVFHWGDLGGRRGTPEKPIRLWLQLGVAGFAFGNVMMLSFPGYLGLGEVDRAGLRLFLGCVSLVLSLPALLYSASDYWRAAWQGLRLRTVTLDLPIAAGMVALFGQSVWEIISGHGPGYLDSLTGLIFFLLCGRWFQNRTFERLEFDRDYRSYFPLTVTRVTAEGVVETVSLGRVRVGDRLRLRHGEMLPADARLVRGTAEMDYSFVTGESDPVRRQPGDLLYAGGQQMGGPIEVEVVRPVSQGYLNTLWSRWERPGGVRSDLTSVTNRFSRWFVLGVGLVALGTGVYWGLMVGVAAALLHATAVLIVACPCALALSAPFALGTAQRWLARCGVFLKSSQVLETLARVTTVVFDKTGTLTTAGSDRMRWVGEPLEARELAAVTVVASASMHPLARQLVDSLRREGGVVGGQGLRVLDGQGEVLEAWREFPGRGVEGWVCGMAVCLGSAGWLRQRGVAVPEGALRAAHSVHVAIQGRYRGRFQLRRALRDGLERLVAGLRGRYRLALLSGDQPGERAVFVRLFGLETPLQFCQGPERKQEFVKELRRRGEVVMMVGDGLNDAGALRESDVGVAVVEETGAFCPASDVILEARRVVDVPALLELGRRVVRVVYVCFGLSLLYNAVGLTLAVQGRLSPLFAAVLMPLSSVTVVSVATGLSLWQARRCGWTTAPGGGEGGEP
jgi:Cu+-exporting ATPase